MSETDLSALSCSQLRQFGSVHRIENKLDKGTPDVCAALRFPGRDVTHTVWIEHKHCRRWPAGDETPLHIKSFTLEQLLWLEGWHGRCCVILQVARDYLLLPPCHLRKVFERRAPEEIVRALATVQGAGKYPTPGIIRWLTRDA